MGPARSVSMAKGRVWVEAAPWVSNANYRVLPPPGQPFSLSFWFSVDAPFEGWQGLAGQNANLMKAWSLALWNAAQARTSWCSAVIQRRVHDLNRPYPAAARQWHELALARDSDSARIYLDGALLGRGVGTLTNA